MRVPPLSNRTRWPVLAAWALGAAVLIPRAAGLERSLDVGARVAGSESAAVEAELEARFGSPFAQFAVLVVTGGPRPTGPAGLRLLDSLAAVIRSVPGVTGVAAYRSPADSLLLGSDGRTSLVVAGIGGVSPDVMVARLRAATAGVRGATLRWTGQAALNADLRRVSATDAATAERRVLPLSLALLLVAFGTLVAAALPVLAGTLTIVLASGAAAFIAARWPLALIVQNVISMIGLGLGIDYALLTVSRFREALAAGMTPAAAARDTVRHAGETIALSGLAVAVGFAGLLVIPVNELRSVGVGGLLTVGVAVLVATTLLPALLAWIGPRIDRLSLPFARPAGSHRAGWRRWGGWVTRHPLATLCLAGVPVVCLAWPASRLRVGEPSGDWLPPRIESAVGLRELERAGRGGVLQTLRVVIDLPPGGAASTASGWSALQRLHAHVAADPRVAFVRSAARPDGATRLPRVAFLGLPDSIRRTLVTADGRAAVLDVVPREGIGDASLLALARELRRIDARSVSGLSGTRVRVGGLPAFRADYLDAVGGALPLVGAVIVAGTLVALAIGFRSVLVPCKAVALNLVSVAAGFGAVVLVFQDGHGVQWLGIERPLGGVFSSVPALVFCVVFGLSMDYEVFLVARVREARRRGCDEDAALVEGLGRTAGVITSAAAIMIAVFAAFTLGEFVLLKMLGFALAVAVLLDATVIRMAIGPALLRLAGRWNWWPGR